MSVLRDILRRRARSLLTVFGIAVGVFALVMLGAVAEKVGTMLATTADYYADKVIVIEEKAGSSFGFSLSGDRPLSRDAIERVRAYPGVLDAAPEVQLMVDDSALPVLTPSMILGGSVGTTLCPETWRTTEGRRITDGEHRVADVGIDLAKQLDVTVGDTVTLRGERYEVVGVAERSFGVRDQGVVVPLGDAQRLYARSLPPALASSIDTGALYMQATAYVKPGQDADALAALLNRDVAGIKATGPAELSKQLGSWVAILIGMLMAVASIALLVGGLSVVNTMLMSVTERSREVGLKRALGASRLRVAGDILAESGLMAGLGGLVGLAAASLASAVLNVVLAAGGGLTLFLLTPRLALTAVVFALLLGGIAGAYPAWRISRADPVALLSSR